MRNKLRILGLMTALSYMICVLYTWVSAVLNGHVYFSAGEPNKIILYTEWILGSISLGVLTYELIRLLNKNPQVIYDPPV